MNTKAVIVRQRRKLNGNRGAILPAHETIESRVASAETAILGLAQSIDKVTALVGSLEESVASGFRDLNSQIRERSKPQYFMVFGTIFGAMTVLLTIIGGVGSIVFAGQTRDFVRMEGSVAKIEAELSEQDHVNLTTAVTLGERKAIIERNAQAVTNLEESMRRIETRQYENRDLITALRTKVDMEKKP